MARGKRHGRYSPRRAGGGDDGGESRWLTTYGDAVTLLMAFFVMLYAMSQIDQVKFEAFLRGLEVPFGNPAVTEMALDAGTGIVGEAAPTGLTDIRPEPITIHELSQTDERDAAAEPVEPVEDPVVEEEQDVGEVVQHVRELSDRDLEQLREVRDAVMASLAEADLVHLADESITERGLVVSIAADNVLFDLGSTTISPLGRRIVEAIAHPLVGYPNDVLVEGHTDDVPLERAGYTNWNLSTDRAVAVLSLMYSDFGIREPRLGAVGFGEFRPRVRNDSPANRALNRRVDVLIVAQGD
jgi:chemotaxis protein MotB